MRTYLLLKSGEIVCRYGYNGMEYTVYTLDQRKTPANERKYFHVCLSDIVQSDTNITVLGGAL